EDDRRRHRDLELVVVDVGLDIGNEGGIEEIGRHRRRGPGTDRQDLAREAAHHGQHCGYEGEEIGRASCRERVEISVGGGISSRRRHTRFSRDWSSDVCSSDLKTIAAATAIWSLSLST